MYLDALLMYDCLYIFIMSFTSVFLFLNNLDLIINVYVFVICLIWPYLFIGSLLYEFVCDPLVVLLVLSVQALIQNNNKKKKWKKYHKYCFGIPIFFK